MISALKLSGVNICPSVISVKKRYTRSRTNIMVFFRSTDIALFIFLSSSLILFFLGHDIKDDSNQKHDALYHTLIVRIDTHDTHALVDHAH